MAFLTHSCRILWRRIPPGIQSGLQGMAMVVFVMSVGILAGFVR